MSLSLTKILTLAFTVIVVEIPFPLVAQEKSPHRAITSIAVPLVACRNYAGNGGSEDGDLPETKVNEIKVQIDAEDATKLAFYRSSSVGTLGPRGWFCIGYSGTSGASLFVTPKPIKRGMKFSGIGDAVIATLWDASTSGRFPAAEVVARLFPAYKLFPETVEQVGLRDPASFNYLPYARDRVTYLSDSVAKVKTPPATDGLGTDSGFKKDKDPINSVAILVKPSDDTGSFLDEKSGWEGTAVLLLNVRFQDDAQALTRPIIEHFAGMQP